MVYTCSNRKKKYIVLAIIFFCSGMQGTFTFDMEVFGSRALPTANLKKKALNIHAHTHIYIFWFVTNDFIGLILFLLVFEQNAHTFELKNFIYRCVLVVEHKGSSTPCKFNLS